MLTSFVRFLIYPVLFYGLNWLRDSHTLIILVLVTILLYLKREYFKKQSDIVPNSESSPPLEIETLILRIKGRDTVFDGETLFTNKVRDSWLNRSDPSPPLGKMSL